MLIVLLSEKINLRVSITNRQENPEYLELEIITVKKLAIKLQGNKS